MLFNILSSFQEKYLLLPEINSFNTYAVMRTTRNCYTFPETHKSNARMLLLYKLPAKSSQNKKKKINLINVK